MSASCSTLEKRETINYKGHYSEASSITFYTLEPLANKDLAYVWTDGEDLYISGIDSNNNYYHYIYDPDISVWKVKTWNGGDAAVNFINSDIWTDGTTIYHKKYYSSSSNYSQYALNKATSTWSYASFSPTSNFTYTNHVGQYTYMDRIVDSGSTSNYYHYYLDPTNSRKWIEYTQLGSTSIKILYSSYYWSDGEHVYYSNGSVHYEVTNGYTATTKTWYGLTSFSGSSVWTDGTDIYYSSGSSQYVLNKSTSTWVVKTWYGLTEFNRQGVRKVGDDIYYLSTIYPYSTSFAKKLDRSTSTWNDITMHKVVPFSVNAAYVWTDRTNIYYSEGSKQYILDTETGLATTKTWTGLTSFGGNYIWTDGTDIYYSGGSYQYILDKATSTWSAKTWNGLSSFYGYSIWSDDTDIYYSNGASYQYVLNKSTSTWESKTWNGLTAFYGSVIWRVDDEFFAIWNASGSTGDIKWYKLIKGEDTWTTVTNGAGYTSKVYTDGLDIYIYGTNATSRRYDKTLGQFINCSFNSPTTYMLEYTWTDGQKLFYSSGTETTGIIPTWIPD